MLLRPTTSHVLSTLKSVCARAMRQVTAASFANDTRVSEQQLSRYCRPYEEVEGKPDINFMPADIIADLEQVVGYPVISEYLVGLCGYKVVAGDEITRQPTMDDVGAIADAKGKLLSMLIRALLDGKIDQRESREILPALDEAIDLLQDFRRNIQACAP